MHEVAGLEDLTFNGQDKGISLTAFLRVVSSRILLVLNSVRLGNPRT